MHSFGQRFGWVAGAYFACVWIACYISVMELRNMRKLPPDQCMAKTRSVSV